MSGRICVLLLHMLDGILEHGHRHAVERDDAREDIQGDGLHEALVYSGGHRTLSVQKYLDDVAMGNAIDDRYRRGQFAHDEPHVIYRQSDVR